MDYLPLVHASCVYVGEKAVFSGTLGEAIRWMCRQPAGDRSRFQIMIEHHREAMSFETIERIALRTGTLGDDPVMQRIAA